jgi:RHS repeat-associated protein
VPVGWTVHAFYNDIDSTRFYDADVYDAGIPFPDLKTAALYGGVENGGHRLDGMEYYSGFYNVNDSSTHLSWTRTTYNLVQAPGMPKQTYWIQPDTIVSYVEGFIDSTFIYYDSLKGLPVMTKKRANSESSPIVYSVDSTLYAYKVADGSQAGILSANAITLPYEQFSYVDSANVKKYRSRSRTLYEKKGSWRPKESYSWFNPAYTTSDSAIKTFSTMSTLSESYDARGNAINSKDAMGVISSVKYDSDNVLPVATAVNAKNTEWLYQDFEQLPAISTTAGWDTWRVDSAGVNQFLTDSTRMTGRYCYTRKNHTSSNDTAWGPYRVIPSADLSDDHYYFSFWVKTDHKVHIAYFGRNSGNAVISGQAKFKTFTPTANTWVLIQDTLDLTGVRADSGFNNLKVQLVLGQNASAKYAHFDDFRLHPLDAQMSATIYNTKSLPIVSSGPMNIPTQTVYDSLMRPTSAKDWSGKTLSSTQYHKLDRDSFYIKSTYPQFGTDSTSFIVDSSQMLHYRLTINTSESVHGGSYIYKNGTLINSHYCVSGPCSSNETDSFSVVVGDTVKLVVIRTDTSPSSGTYTSTVLKIGPALYAESAPNWVRQEQRVVRTHGDTATVVSKSFTDALGRVLQTRSTNYDGGTEKALVSGVAVYDARGRAIKSYLPYYDLSSPMTVDDFSLSTQAVTEINGYYDGTPGPDCDSVAFMESKYDTTFQSPLIKAAGTSDTYKMSSGKINVFKHKVNSSLNIVADTILDPDGNLSYSVKDRWGLYSKTISKYTKSTGSVDSVKMITYSNLRGDSTWLAVDSGSSSSEILLRWSKRDGLGRETKMWRVDYGGIRMLYDKAGRLRFMQNDKRLAESKFVYFKYDALGRKIEEGLEDSSSTCFTQANANNPDWPVSGNSPTIHYKWYYDYYVNGTDTLRGMGKLVRVLSGDSTYYRNYRYFPLADSNNVVVKLPTLTNTKAISHIYNFDGSLKQLTISPKGLSDGTGRRKIAYRYDRSGRLESISPTPSLVDQENYTLYAYEPDGKVNSVTTGIYINELTSTYDTVQVLNYRYNAAGMLTDINRIDASPWIIGTLAGDGAGSDHFGLKMHYFDGDTSYYNGRASSIITYNSSGSGVFKRAYDYRYNELGWLTKADADSGVTTTNDQRYYYNALGQRKMIITGVSDTTFYTYYTDTPGSSRLKSITGMGSVQMRYDTLGNLTADTSRSIYSIAYDYRNLPTQTYVAANQSGGAQNWIDFKYDETEQRLQKTWHYQVWALCEGGGEDFVGEGEGGGETESEGGGGCPPGQICGDSCLGFVEGSTFYLYDDDGTLLATFDKTDAVIDLFVNGPEGTIASYSQNNNSYLYYYLKDQIGSTRVTVSGAPPNATNPYTVNQYYTYHPFGGVNESWVSYNTQFKFTGKEHDKHSTFEFDYFGARYYDSRTGLFITADKAAQFLSAYLYGGNNPILGRDANGNWFGIDDLIITGLAFIQNYVSYGISEGKWGSDALKSATVAAGAAWLSYNTANLANSQLRAAGVGRVLSRSISGGVGGAVGMASSSAGIQVINRMDVNWDYVGQSALYGFGGGMASTFFTQGMVEKAASSELYAQSHILNSLLWSKGFFHAGGQLLSSDKYFRSKKKDSPEFFGDIFVPLLMDVAALISPKLVDKYADEIKKDAQNSEDLKKDYPFKTGPPTSANLNVDDDGILYLDVHLFNRERTTVQYRYNLPITLDYYSWLLSNRVSMFRHKSEYYKKSNY